MRYITLQTNGERIPVEGWVVDMWRRGELTDPHLINTLQSAVVVYLVRK